VMVVNPVPGGPSAPVAFGVAEQLVQPIPELVSLTPPEVPAGSDDRVIALNGVRFTRTSRGFAGETELATTYVDGSRLAVLVPRALLAAPAHTVPIKVVTPPPGGGTSATVLLQVQ
jgi:hypothetical protein